MKLTLFRKTGIVHHYEVIGTLNEEHCIQLIVNGKLYYKILNLNESSPVEEIRSPIMEEPISNYDAVYIDGVQIVKMVN